MMRSNRDITASTRKMQITSFVVYALVVACWSSALLNGSRATVGTAPISSQADARLPTFPDDAGLPTR